MARWKDTKDYIYVSDEDAAKLLTHISPKFKLPAQILRLYGLRVSEVLMLTPANFRNGEMVLRRLKKGRLTKQIIAPEIKSDLFALMDQKEPGTRLFPFTRTGLWYALQTAAMRSGVDLRVAHPHAFRHAAGRRWARMGTLPEVAAMMGHSALQSTMQYARLECDSRLSENF